ncbi:MAG: BamA/TamA family outer membrane protein [Bacteroidales bacterium]|jgi:outer membrane protein assembly factor BamA|nr:BamA/TamA family outer membrane protein [Bacteroidales bacterium]
MRAIGHLFSKTCILLPVVAAALFLYGCSATKYVPQGEFLLNRVEIKTDNKKLSRDELHTQIAQESNFKILGLWKFHLGLYNLSSRKHENGWLKRIGEAPVVYNPALTAQSLQQLSVYMQNKGYYSAAIADTLEYHPKRRKVNMTFYIKSGTPYHIRNFYYQTQDDGIRPLVLRDTVRQKVRSGSLFDVDMLDAERDRVATMLKNRGYYMFSKDYIQYLADTLYPRQADITMVIADADPSGRVDTVVPHKRFIVRDYTVNTNFSPMRLQNNRDTLHLPPYSIIYDGKLRYKPQLIDNLNRIRDGRYYSLRNVEKTYRSLNQIKQFHLVNLNFTNVGQEADSVGTLACNFQLTPLKRSEFSFAIEGTNSSGNLGIAGNYNHQWLNLFRGAEILNIRLKGAFERQQTMVNERSLNFNTQEFGIESSLKLPKFIGPFNGSRMFNFQVPQTYILVGYNFQARPDYTRTITTFQYGYQWKSSLYRNHTLNVLDVNYVRLPTITANFLNSINDLYIRSSYTDHLITALNYTQVNNRSNPRTGNYRYFKWAFESAGNVLAAVSALSGQHKTYALDTLTQRNTGYYEAFGTRFAQYLKADFEYRYGYRLDQHTQLVSRIFAGVGLPYGNFDIMPFERKYFSGGANGIRAWQVRTLGPGTYRAPENAYPNQSADIKIEGNIEYRFPLISPAEGAFFIDAGNIWAINRKDNREGALFRFDSFYRQFAIGTGAGLRFNFSYFIFRLDLGMKLRDPSLEPGKRFIIGNYPLSSRHFNLSFAIDYPF